MVSYILNSDVLCFTQDPNDESSMVIIEKKRKLFIKIDCLKFLRKCCRCYGNTYSNLRQFVIDKFNFYIKTPIVLSEKDMIILFPTASPNSKECIWISYSNVDRYIKEKDYTKIYFKGGKIINISASYRTIDNQITKCIKIEKYINDSKLKK